MSTAATPASPADMDTVRSVMHDVEFALNTAIIVTAGINDDRIRRALIDSRIRIREAMGEVPS